MLRPRTIRCVLACLALVAATLASSSVYAQSQSGGPLFTRVSVDSERPYLGQQITYVVKIYQRSDFTQRLRYIAPGFAGFWNSQPTQRDEYTEAIGSEQYRVIELRTLLFPSVVETITIEPASLRADTGLPGGSDSLETEPVVVEVRSLPAGAPPGFVGAIGRFDISAEVNATTGTVNEPVVLTVKIRGDGNVEALPDPAWPEFSGWRAVESPPVAEAHISDGKVTGIRTYEFGLVPEEAGDLTIPAISYPHYDPEVERYVQTDTGPIVVAIEGAEEALPPVTDEMEVEQSEAEVRHNKLVPPSLGRSRSGLTDTPVYWAAWVVPLLIIVGAALWRRRIVAREAALATSRQRNALRNARAVLARADSSGADPRTAAADAVLSYMSDRLDVPLGGLTRDSLHLRLREVGVSSELVQRVEEILAGGETARYSPVVDGVDRAEDSMEQATQLLTDLEEVFET